MLMQFAAIFDGSENDTFRIKNIFSYFCSKHRSLLGTRRRFLKRVSFNNMYNYEGVIKSSWVSIFKVFCSKQGLKATVAVDRHIHKRLTLSYTW